MNVEKCYAIHTQWSYGKSLCITPQTHWAHNPSLALWHMGLKNYTKIFRLLFTRITFKGLDCQSLISELVNLHIWITNPSYLNYHFFISRLPILHIWAANPSYLAYQSLISELSTLPKYNTTTIKQFAYLTAENLKYTNRGHCPFML